MTQDEHESKRNDPGRNNKRTVGETDVILKIPSYSNFKVPDARTFLLQASSGALIPKLLNEKVDE